MKYFLLLNLFVFLFFLSAKADAQSKSDPQKEIHNLQNEFSGAELLDTLGQYNWFLLSTEWTLR